MLFPQYYMLLNGIYDIVCGSVALALQDTKWLHIHHNLFKTDYQSPVLMRALAIWTTTYGAIRLGAGVDACLIPMAIVSYFLEALYYMCELRAGTQEFDWKAMFISITCVIIGLAAVPWAP